MKDNATGKKRALYYAILAVSVLLLTAATVLTVYFAAGGNKETLGTGDKPQEQPDEDKDPDEPGDPTGGDATQFVNPMSEVTVTSGFGFYHNQTLGWFYEHEGLDLSAAAGTPVVAMADGTVESISTDEVNGTQIVLDHGDGLKTLYRFVTAQEGLEAGDSVKQGETIASVSEATGNEYKDGAHLHLEVMLDGANVDPTEYLILGEK